MNLIVHWLAGFRFFYFIGVLSLPLMAKAADGQFVHWLPSPAMQPTDDHTEPDSFLSGSNEHIINYKEIISWLKSAPTHGIDWPEDIRSKLTGYTNCTF